MSTKISDLIPEAREVAINMLSALDEEKIDYLVTSTLRTVDEQVALFSQGRSPLDIVNLLRHKAGMRPITAAENTYTVTKCDGVTSTSNHQTGRSFDIVPVVNHKPTWDYRKYSEQYKVIGNFGKRLGLRWGGDWPPLDEVSGLGWDPPHFEI